MAYGPGEIILMATHRGVRKLCIREAQSGQMRGQSTAIRAHAHVNGALTDVTTNGIDNSHTIC